MSTSLASPAPSLSGGAWGPSVLSPLNEALSTLARGDVAVFDFDDTLVNGDCGDGLLAALLGTLRLALGAEALISLFDRTIGAGPDGPVRDAASKALASLAPVARALEAEGGLAWGGADPARRAPLVGSELHRRFATGVWRLYRQLEHGEGYGPGVAFPLHCCLHGGRSAGDLSALALRLLTDLRAPEWLWDRHPLEPIPEMSALVNALKARGVDVWVVTGSTHPVVSALTESGAFGFTLPADRVLGVVLDEEAGVLQPRLCPDRPFTWGPGKVAAIERYIRRAPSLVAGDSRGDLDMLSRWPTTRVRLLLPPGDPGGLRPACERHAAGEPGWLRQPRDPSTGRWIPEVRSGS